MRALAAFVMRGPLSAALVAATAAVLSLLMPPLLLLSGAAIALVALRLGLQQGLLVAAVAMLAGGMLSWLALGTLAPLLWLGFIYWLPLLLLALVLRATISLAVTLRVAAALGALGVLAFYVALGDPAQWWIGLVNDTLGRLEGAGASDPALMEQLRGAFTAWAPLVPGQMITSALGALILALLLARWWQSLLYNPGGFGQEFHELRLGKPLAATMLALLALSLVLALPLIVNLTLMLGFIYLIQGVALVHALVAKVGLSKIWLVAFYLLMLLLLSQLVMILGALDAWVDFRNRLKSSNDQPPSGES